MPLTPADVRNKQFTTTRLKPGYDEDEVDAFLDEVETELDRLIQENEELRSKLAESTRTGSSFAAAPSVPQEGPATRQAEPPQPEPAPEQPQRLSGLPGSEQTQVQQPDPPAPAAAAEQPASPLPTAAAATGGSGDDTMQSASRMLALAQQTADQAVSDARREADETVGKAQREAEETLGKAQWEAEETVGKARRQAEQIMSEARSRAEALERDAQERHRQSMGTLVRQREDLERKVDDLRAFEREYRSRLKAYLEGQLQDLESGAPEEGPRSNDTSGESQPMSTPSSEVHNGQSGWGAPGPSGPPMVQPEAAQHAGSGFRPGPDNGPPHSR